MTLVLSEDKVIYIKSSELLVYLVVGDLILTGTQRLHSINHLKIRYTSLFAILDMSLIYCFAAQGSLDEEDIPMDGYLEPEKTLMY